MDISDYCLLITRTSAGPRSSRASPISGRYQTAGIESARSRRWATRHRHHAGSLQRREGACFGGAWRSRPRLGGGRCLPVVRAALPVCRANGSGSAAFEYALAYAKSRKQFGRPIGQFQAISHKLADMKVMLDVSRTLVYRFAWLLSQGQATRSDAAVLKLYTGEPTRRYPISDCRFSRLRLLHGISDAAVFPDSRLAVIGGGLRRSTQHYRARLGL